MIKEQAQTSPILLRSLALLGSLLAAGLLPGAEKPNVLFINIDDLRCDTGCYGVTASGAPREPRQSRGNVARTRERDARGGHPLVKTPNMDKLAEKPAHAETRARLQKILRKGPR